MVCPILRKDFIVDPYQLLEARLHGASAILLIAAALDDSTLRNLFRASLYLGLTPLIEVHDEGELDARVAAGAATDRDQQSQSQGFHGEPGHDAPAAATDSANVMPWSRRAASTSRRKCASCGRLASMRSLIGEALVTAPDPGLRLRELKEAGQ